MNFKEELKKYQSYINSELKKSVNQEECPEEVLNVAVEYSLMAGGKRLRPVLILAVYKMISKENNFDKCIPFLIAMEQIHNFSLIHDDLPGIDNDDFRHGKPTNHKAFNESTAILAGDKLLNGAYHTISKYIITKLENGEDIQNDIKAFNELTYSTDRMIVGEYIDTESENKQIPPELVSYIHENKTGALIRASARIGAILAGATEKELENITTYAEKIGLAFQIKDDILGEIGDEKVTGKPVGNDKAMGKSTYVSMYGVEIAQDKLEIVIEEAIASIRKYDETCNFLIALAKYIRDREK